MQDVKGREASKDHLFNMVQRISEHPVDLKSVRSILASLIVSTLFCLNEEFREHSASDVFLHMQCWSNFFAFSLYFFVPNWLGTRANR